MLNLLVALIVVAGVFSICEIAATLRLSAELKRFNKQKAKTLDYQRLYKELLDDVHGLRADLRSMQLGASDREAPAFGDAEEMTADILARAEERKKCRNVTR